MPMKDLTSSPQAQFRSIVTMLQSMDNFIETKQSGRTEASPKTTQGATPGSATKAQTRTRQAPRTASPSRSRGPKAAPRFRTKAKIVIHKNDRYIKGRVINISQSGLFVCSDRKIFRDNEVVRISIKLLGMSKYYKAIARVVRFNTDQRYLKGYGLQFISPERVLRY